MEIKNKTNAVAYTAPECKAVEVELANNLLVCSGYNDATGISNIDDVENGSENDHSGKWVF